MDDPVEKKAKGIGKKDGATLVAEGLGAGVSNLWGLCQRSPEDFIELRIKQRADMDVMAVAKYFSEDGTPMVVFGWGYDFLSALMGVNAALAAGKGRVDRPWEPGKGTG